MRPYSAATRLAEHREMAALRAKAQEQQVSPAVAIHTRFTIDISGAKGGMLVVLLHHTAPC